MRTITLQLYKYEELSNEAKNKVRDEWRSLDGDTCSQENSVSILAIARALNCKIDYNHYNDTGFGGLNDNRIEDYILDLSGIRALAYIENNYITPYEKGRYYSTTGQYIDGKFNYNYRYSKVTKVFSCPFTGYYLDDCILDGRKKFIDQLRAGATPTIADYIKYVSDSISEELQAEYDWQNSDEYADEMIEANWDNVEFYSDGRRYAG